MRPVIALFGSLLLFSAFTSAQSPNAAAATMRADAIRERTRGKVTLTTDDPHQNIPAPDLAKVQQQSDELNQLVKSLDDDIVSMRKGLMAADMSQKLKRIEKLAKEIRHNIE
jgi:hypothetical protein